MKFRQATTLPVVLLVAFLAMQGSSAAQAHRYKLGGVAGFASLKDPKFDLGGTPIFGGFFGLRLNDNFSFETRVTFAGSDREFNVIGAPLDKRYIGNLRTPELIPVSRVRSDRYHADGTLLIHIGRRQPFQPFVFAGGGAVRRDYKQLDITFTADPETGDLLTRDETTFAKFTEYELTGHVGAGFDFYFMYNLAARAEFRFWIPQTWEKRTRAIFLSATYYF